MKHAGYPSGKYTGNDEILMVGANADPGKAQAEVARAQLREARLQGQAPPGPAGRRVQRSTARSRAKKVAVCAGAGWFKDFADPQSMLEPTFKGTAIVPDGNIN